jgi:hypothetical protein
VFSVQVCCQTQWNPDSMEHSNNVSQSISIIQKKINYHFTNFHFPISYNISPSLGFTSAHICQQMWVTWCVGITLGWRIITAHHLLFTHHCSPITSCIELFAEPLQHAALYHSRIGSPTACWPSRCKVCLNIDILSLSLCSGTHGPWIPSWMDLFAQPFKHGVLHHIRDRITHSGLAFRM